MAIAQYVGVLIEKSIRRRNYVTTYVHEIPIIQRMHDCPVYVLRITDEGRDLSVADEWERLTQKYGEENERPFIEQIYRHPGELEQGILRRMTESDLSPLARSLEETEIDDTPILAPKVKLSGEETTVPEQPQQVDGEPVPPKPMDLEMLSDVLTDWGEKVDARWGEARMREEVRRAAIGKLNEFGIDEIEHDLSAEQLVDLAETMQERQDALEA